MIHRGVIAALFLMLTAMPGVVRAEGKTFDKLTDAELDTLAKSTRAYYLCVSSRLDSLRSVDNATPQAVFGNYPPYIRIFRQQCRISLLSVERDMYAMGLNPEFISGYVGTLREDVFDFALDQALRKAEGARQQTREREEWEKKADPPPSSGGLNRLLPGLESLLAP